MAGGCVHPKPVAVRGQGHRDRDHLPLQETNGKNQGTFSTVGRQIGDNRFDQLESKISDI